ncbi:hypothetical protein M8745_19410, partial [Lutimaribacter sp. EGI FJ00014]|nr:hypothetical protein [Lutimaribacter sp. EGI FJ00014]
LTEHQFARTVFFRVMKKLFYIVSLNANSNQRHASKNVNLKNTFMHIVQITETCLHFLACKQAVGVI